MRKPSEHEPRLDNLYADEPHWVVPHSCPCCVKCWFVVKGKGAGRCVNGGPYLGYVEVPDDPATPEQ